MKKENRLYWRKLDNSAKIFPISAGKKYSTVFRLSAILKEKVHPKILQKAVLMALEKYQSFKVRMKDGFFWNYFEEKSTPPKVEKEEKFPCSSFELYDPKSHIVRVLYYNNRISVECFQAVADGRSILKFFNSLLRRYFI